MSTVDISRFWKLLFRHEWRRIHIVSRTVILCETRPKSLLFTNINSHDAFSIGTEIFELNHPEKWHQRISLTDFAIGHRTGVARDDLLRQRVMYNCASLSTKAYTQQLHHTCQNCVYQSPPALDVISCVQQHMAICICSSRTSTSTYGPRSFAVSGPSVWNKLPATLRVSPTLGQFQSKLKAVLFRSAYETWLGAFVTA